MNDTVTITQNSTGYQVSMSTKTAQADIYYTTDGTDPDNTSNKYEGPLNFPLTFSLRAVAYRDDIGYSNIIKRRRRNGATVVGIERSYNNITSCTRLTQMTDPLEYVTEDITASPIIATTSKQGSSPFNSIAPWNGIKRRNFISNAPGPWEGEEGFDTAAYDTMVWIPKFYYKVTYDTDTSMIRYYVSDILIDGFLEHPGSGQYVGAFVTSNMNESKSGKYFQTSVSINQMRISAREKGSGWELVDIAQRSALQLLYIIEFNSFDSQGIFGQTAGESGETGSTDGLGYHTGRYSNDKIVYRYVEDLWNGVYEYTDGFNTVLGHHYVSTDRDNYASDITSGYTELGSWAFSGTIGSFKYFENLPWLIGVPDTSGSGYDSGYLYDTSSNLVLYCGGYWSSGSDYGLFCFHANLSSSGAASNWGSRLSYKEPSAA